MFRVFGVSFCGARSVLVCLLLSAVPLGAHAGLQSQIWVTYANGLQRYYDLYVPDTPANQPRPLIIDMHGAGQTPASQRRRSGFTALADSEQFIVAYPAGEWNSYFGGKGADDVAAIRAIVDHIASTHDVDPKRIYASGWSLGGEMAYRLACDAADFITAVSSVAGGVLVGSEPECRPIRPAAVLSFRGVDDGIVPYGSGFVTGTTDKILSATQTHDFWKEMNGCTGSDQNLNLGSASCVTNAQCDGSVRVTSCSVEGGGAPDHHALYDAPNLDIARESWNFFKAFTLAEVQTSSFLINPGLSDAWYDPDTAGQGFFIIVLEQTGIVFMAWFTYDTELPPADTVAHLGAPEHRWLTAQGPYDGDTAILDVYNTVGGVFDSPSPAPTTGDPIGTVTIKWTDCENGVLSYDLDQPMISGQIPISRIVSDNVPLCEALLQE